MNQDVTVPTLDDACLAPPSVGPSVDFIHAISEFFDTDPSDLLVELGYYQRDAQSSHTSDRTETSMQSS